MRRFFSCAFALGFAISITAPAEAQESRARSAALAIAKGATLHASGTDRFADGDVVVRYEQSHRGLPVIGRGVAVRVDGRGATLASSSSLAADLPSSIDPTVTAMSAARIASRFTPLGVRASDAHLVVWTTLDGRSRLAYAVLPHVPAGIPTAPRIVVDAQTAEVLEARDLVTFAQARSYQYNPNKTPAVTNFDLPMATDGATLKNAFVEASNCVDNKTVKPVTLLNFNLQVHICDLVNTAVADASGNFLYEPQDQPGSAASKSDAFSEVSIYYHTAKAYQFFRDLQGDPQAQVVVDKPLRVIANLQIPAGLTSGNIAKASDPNVPLEPFQNAFFSPAGGELGALFQQLYGFESGALWFGQGPTRDYAYDGDVVYHEFGHAVVDATMKLGSYSFDERGIIDAPGAMNEGLADYFSSAITGDAAVGEYAATDLGGGASVIRTLDNQDKCPNALIGEVHYDSTLFSGALWQARRAVAPSDQTTFDRAIYKAMRTTSPSPMLGFEGAANLFLATLRKDFPAGATALETAMKDRGVLPLCDRVLTVTEKALKSPEPRFGFSSPGTATANIKGIAPGILQMKTEVPAGTAAVLVSFVARSGGGGAQSLLGGQQTPFKPVILAKTGKAITWSTGKTPHDADLRVDTEGTDKRTARVEVPEAYEGALYLQIVNAGESDGAYDNVEIGFEALPVTEPEPTPGTKTITEEGCGCSTPGHSTGLPWGFAGMGAAALVLASRIRRRHR